MSLRRTQREVDSPEFSEWLAFWDFEAELVADLAEHKPNEEETVARLRGWAAAHNARIAAQGR